MLGVLLCTTYIIIIYRNNKNLVLHQQILISIFTIFIFVQLNFYGSVNNIRPLMYFTFYVTFGSKVIIPVLLFFYIKSLFYDDKKILQKHSFLLIFPILFFLLLAIPHIVLKIIKNLAYLLDNYKLFSTLNPITYVSDQFIDPLRILLNISALLYLSIDLKYFYKLRKALKSNYSQISNNNFIWVRFLFFLLLTLIGVDFVLLGLQYFFDFLIGWKTTEILTAFVLAISIVIMGYFGIKQTKIFIPYFLLESEDNALNKTALKQENKDVLSNNDFEELKHKLIDYFEIERPYLDTDLTLGKLAFKIGVTDKKMSALLNNYLEISFYEFVNNYRVKAFKKAIEENKHNDFTIEAISNECGFKSRASFYRIFKLKASMSPSEYINSFKK